MPASSATGTVNVNRVPRPTPSLSAQMRPPCASTSPLQTSKPILPRPARSGALSLASPYFRNKCGNLSRRNPPAFVGYRDRYLRNRRATPRSQSETTRQSASPHWTRGC